MYLRTIFIERFGGLDNFKLNLSDHINIIEGHNESGKSTVCSFIKFIFYGFKDKRERNLHMSWNSDSVSGHIVIYFGERIYRIERECTAGGIDNSRIIDIGTNTSVFTDMTPSEVFFGVPADVFDRTVFVRQANNGNNGSVIDGKGIGEAIENMLQSADESVNTDKALKKLDDARVMLLHKNEKGGKIYELENEAEDLNLRLRRAIESNHDIIIKENYLNRLKQSMADNTERQIVITSEIKHYENVTLAVKYDEFTKVENEIAVLEEEIARLQSDTMNGMDFLPDYDYVENIKSLEIEIAEYDKTIKNIDVQLDNINEFTPEQTDFFETLDRHGGHAGLSGKIENYILTSKTLGIWISVFGLLFFAMTAAAIFTSIYFDYRGLFILIGSIACLIGLLVCYVKTSHQKILCNLIYDDFKVKNDAGLELLIERMMDETYNNKDRSDRIYLLNKNREHMILQRDEKIAELSGCLKIWNKSSSSSAVLTAEKYFAALKDKQYELDKSTLKYKTLSQALTEIEVDENELINTKIDNVDNIDIKALRREYDFIHQSNEAIKNKIHETEKQLAVLKASGESPSVVSDNLTVVKDKIKNMRQSHNAYLLAYEKLSEAVIDMKETASPKLSVYAGDLISRFTSGKYNTLGVGHDLKMEYATGNNTRSANYMSAGTLDIAYLSLRMALTKLLYRDIDPPVLLDESFARLDDDRLKNVLSLLSEITSDNNQILLFTSQKRDAVIMATINADFNHIIL